MANPPRILAFAGSARRESLNKKLLANVVEATRAAGATVTVLDLNDLPMPLYHGDLEDAEGMPENAKKLVQLILALDALLISGPELHSGRARRVQNPRDWAARRDED